MLKKTITYSGFDGKQHTEDHYFNLTQAELVKMQFKEGGFEEHLTRIVQANDGQAIIEAFEEILKMSYGIRRPDGNFVKPPEAFEEFKTTEAYSELFLELVTDAKKSAEFIQAIIPSNMSEKVKKTQDEVGPSTKSLLNHLESEGISENLESEGSEMSDEELRLALGIDNQEKVTNGLSDTEILKMNPQELSLQPRPVLMRAFYLKTSK